EVTPEPGDASQFHEYCQGLLAHFQVHQARTIVRHRVRIRYSSRVHLTSRPTVRFRGGSNLTGGRVLAYVSAVHCRDYEEPLDTVHRSILSFRVFLPLPLADKQSIIHTVPAESMNAFLRRPV